MDRTYLKFIVGLAVLLGFALVIAHHNNNSTPAAHDAAPATSSAASITEAVPARTPMEQKFLSLMKARGVPLNDDAALFEAHGLCDMLRGVIGSYYEDIGPVAKTHPDWTGFQKTYFATSTVAAFCPEQEPSELQQVQGSNG